jgi:hypothetical protein
MGFLKKIVGGAQQLLQGGAKAIAGGDGVGGLIKKRVGSLVEKFAPGIGNLLKRSPLANIAKKVIDFGARVGPKIAESGGFLGMVGGLLQKVGGLGSLADIAQKLIGKLGGPERLTHFGLRNLTDTFAQRQAQLMASALAAPRPTATESPSTLTQRA